MNRSGTGTKRARTSRRKEQTENHETAQESANGQASGTESVESQAVRTRNSERSLPSTIDLRARIAIRAYQIYEGRGRSDGRDLEDWFRAEEEVLHKPIDAELD